ncbi:hypothetical protein CASFOL_000430 [Castilleja foliolosa]|uniref:Uncharacterized protein n=1 Tax=Castilleja foliolosa TaxID=1961234 RepID=A0ABD3ESH6_9LAMI
MACSFAPHLHSLPWSSPAKPLWPSLARPNCTASSSSNRTLDSISISASLSSASVVHIDVETMNDTPSTLRELCKGHVPTTCSSGKAEEVGFITPTHVQRETFPVLFSVVTAWFMLRGSGKTLAYLLLIFSVVNPQRSSVRRVDLPETTHIYNFDIPKKGHNRRTCNQIN